LLSAPNSSVTTISQLQIPAIFFKLFGQAEPTKLEQCSDLDTMVAWYSFKCRFKLLGLRLDSLFFQQNVPKIARAALKLIVREMFEAIPTFLAKDFYR